MGTPRRDVTPRRTTALGGLLAAIAVAGCGGDGDTGAAAALAVTSVPEAVWASPDARGLGFMFPRSTGSRACVIHGGGPSPGIRVPGRCGTTVEDLADGSRRVRFVETWRAADFRGQDAPGEVLSFAWTFTVTPAGAVRVASGGDYPPQLVK